MNLLVLFGDIPEASATSLDSAAVRSISRWNSLMSGRSKAHEGMGMKS